MAMNGACGSEHYTHFCKDGQVQLLHPHTVSLEYCPHLWFALSNMTLMWHWLGWGTLKSLFCFVNYPISSLTKSIRKSRVYLFFLGLTCDFLKKMNGFVMHRFRTKKMYIHHFLAVLPTGVFARSWLFRSMPPMKLW